MSSLRRALLLAACLSSACIALPTAAQPGWGGWGPGYGARGWGGDARISSRDPREGRVQAEHFIADDAGDALGHGAVAVVSGPGGSGDAREDATFEAAIVDQLARSGYDTIHADPKGGQVTEITVVRDVVVPEEERRSPVSGAVEAGVSNHGSMMGMELNYDGTKPRKALIETRMEIHIRDRASGKLLWEGRAAIVTREGDSHWTDTAVAGRLAGALFEHFPK
jgi:hypothetical protein